MSHQVYIIHCDGMIKIGCSNNAARRIAEVGSWLPYPIKTLAIIDGSFALERALHDRFAADWSHGEWFRPSPELIDLARRLASGEAIPEPIVTACTERRKAITMKRNLGRNKSLISTETWAAIAAVPIGHAIPDALAQQAVSEIRSARA